MPSMHVVAIISARARSAPAAANIGIGIPDQSEMLPWGAHPMLPSLAVNGQGC